MRGDWPGTIVQEIRKIMGTSPRDERQPRERYDVDGDLYRVIVRELDLGEVARPRRVDLMEAILRAGCEFCGDDPDARSAGEILGFTTFDKKDIDELLEKEPPSKDLPLNKRALRAKLKPVRLILAGAIQEPPIRYGTARRKQDKWANAADAALFEFLDKHPGEAKKIAIDLGINPTLGALDLAEALLPEQSTSERGDNPSDTSSRAEFDRETVEENESTPKVGIVPSDDDQLTLAETDDSTEPPEPTGSTERPGRIMSFLVAVHRRSPRLAKIVIVVLMLVAILPLVVGFAALAAGLKSGIRKLVPMPMSEPSRSVSEFVYLNGPLVAIVLALAITGFIAVLLLPIQSRRMRTNGALSLATVFFVVPFVTYIGLFAQSADELSFFGDLQDGKLRYWETVTVQDFDEPADCAELRQGSDLLHLPMARLDECRVAGGVLQLSGRTISGTGQVTYPRLEDSAPFSLRGDFYATMRFRARQSSPAACALTIIEAGNRPEHYLHLDARPDGSYPGFGAELVTYEGDNATSQKRIDTASNTTLSYVLRPTVFEHEFSNDGHWTSFSVLRQANHYMIFVNRRLVTEYRSVGMARPASVGLSVIAGSPRAAGVATCEFDNLEVLAKP